MRARTRFLPHPRLAVALTLAAAALACRAPTARDYAEVPEQVPEDWQAEDENAIAGEPLDEWWTEFQDPRLDEAIGRVIAENHDLAAAAARVAAAAAQAVLAGAALYPTVGLSGAAARQRQNFVGFPIGGGGDVLSTTTTTYGVSLDLSWELDLWGKLDARAEAATADWRATRADLRGARLSLTAQTAKTWFAYAEAKLQYELAVGRIASFTTTTEIMRARFRDGRIASLDLRLAESQLSSAKAVREFQRENLERVKRQLEILMGDYPAGQLEAPEDLPAMPGPVPIGLPSELLLRRPDLVASNERLRAADLRLFEARAELWPSLSLTAGAGRRSTDVADLFDADYSVWNLAGNLLQPLFQGGRLSAGVDLSDARVRESLATWAQATLRAFSEVEIALAVEGALAARQSQLEDAAGHAQAAEDLAEARYLEGRHDILAVLTARRQSFDADSALITARRQRLEARIDLYLALGGGFEDLDDEPELAQASDEPDGSNTDPEPTPEP